MFHCLKSAGYTAGPITNLAEIAFPIAQVTDVGVSNAVRALPQLCSVNLKFCHRLSDDGVAMCAQLTSLKSLNLTGCKKV